MGELTDVRQSSIIQLLRFLETDIWVERKKKSVVLEKTYIRISKKQPELNENCALKIIIFRYFAFFLELTFYFLLSIHFIS